MKLNRKFIGLAAAAAIVGCTSVPRQPAGSYTHESSAPLKLGIAGYSLCQYEYEDALKLMQELDIHYLCLKDNHVPYKSDAKAVAAAKALANRYGVKAIGAGPQYFCTEAEARLAFDFAKRWGLKVVSVVPYERNPAWKPGMPGRNRNIESEAMLDVLEKLVREYDIKAAIHNHGPDIPLLYPTAEAVMKRIAKRDRRIGVCLDVGHEKRAGLDPVAFINAHADRIYDVHLKNIKIDAKRNLAMAAPRGELDIPGIFTALANNGYEGVCHIEYERDFDNNFGGLAESIGYYRGVLDCIHVKAKMQPVPAGANALTAAERAEGFELLFDGKTLPTDKWVGNEKEWGCKKFPERGWFVKDGCLTMRPRNGISPEGKWFPLPPEDQRLAGGGDIVTVKKYRDFVFKFDFRLTEAANSGVKYFFDETLNKGTCEEYQILEQRHPDYEKGKDGNRKLASLYDILPANADKYTKPLGQWNQGMIVARGNKIEHWLNGVKVVEYVRGNAAFKAAVKASKYATWGVDANGKAQDWGEIPAGRLLLQDHGDSTVSFCNLKVKAL